MADERKIRIEGGDYVEGDKVQGDKVMGDKVMGDKTGITIHGDVGPGAVVGSGNVKARNIAGGNIYAQIESRETDERPLTATDLRATAEEIGYLRAALETLRGELADVAEPGMRGEVFYRLDRLEKHYLMPLLSPGSTKPVKVSGIQKLGDWMLENVPQAREPLAEFLEAPLMQRLVELAGGDLRVWTDRLLLP